MFVITAKLKAVKGKEKELEKLLRSVISRVHQSDEEKDVVIFDMHRKIGDPSEIFFYERYKDRQAWAVTHMSLPFVKECVAALPNYVEGDIEVTEYELVEVS